MTDSGGAGWRVEARAKLDNARAALEANARKQYDPVFGISTAVIEDARSYLDALDAVLALHQPIDWNNQPGKFCGYCWLDNYGDAPLPWPCPTVRAIEGEPHA